MTILEQYMERAAQRVSHFGIEAYASASGDSKMPKTVLTAAEWKRRLSSYAQGEFSFGRGRRPPKWAKELENINNCPRHRSVADTDPFGRKILCRCGYHVPKDAVKVHNR